MTRVGQGHIILSRLVLAIDAHLVGNGIAENRRSQGAVPVIQRHGTG